MSNVSSQAFIQGINDDFLLAAGITMLGFIPIMLLKSKKKSTQNQGKEEKTHFEIID